MWFDSLRKDAGGNGCLDDEQVKRIWRVDRIGEGWGNLAALEGEAFDGIDKPWQPFTNDDGATLYFTATGDDCSGQGCIFRAVRNEAGKYVERTLFMDVPGALHAGNGAALAVGEFSMNVAETRMAFAVVRKHPEGWALDIAYAEKLCEVTLPGRISIGRRARAGGTAADRHPQYRPVRRSCWHRRAAGPRCNARSAGR